MLQYSAQRNAPLVRAALRECGREDLIGYDKRCLIRPARDKQSGKPLSTKKPARSGRRSSNQNRNRQK